MHSSYAIGSLALAASSALAAPQGVTAAIAPQASAPAGCSASHSGQFQITVQNVTTGAKVKRDALECTLTGGILKDAQGRTGYIADNYQFQFDGPPQAGAIYTSGFSLCSNGSLALGGSSVWYQCLSGGFYNLYDRSWAAQCSPIYIEAIGYFSDAAATQATDGQVAGTTVVTSVSQRTDGQPIATTVVSQRTDGQVIATTATVIPKPVSQIGDGQIQNPVSQISDGQIQVHTSATPVSQISDGQIQVHTSVTGAAVSQKTDGQVYKPTATSAAPVPVSQISDGQIQASPVSSMKPATSVTGAPVTQISDGQIQATTAKPVIKSSAAIPVSQISDGQIQVVTPTKAAANITAVASSKPSQVTVNGVPALQIAGSGVVASLVAVVAALLYSAPI